MCGFPRKTQQRAPRRRVEVAQPEALDPKQGRERRVDRPARMTGIGVPTEWVAARTGSEALSPSQAGPKIGNRRGVTTKLCSGNR